MDDHRGADRAQRKRLEALIRAGEPGSLLVYLDWLESHGLDDETSHGDTGAPHDVATMENHAAPIAHDEMLHGIWLYERLTEIAAAVRHGPTGTTWVWAYRGLLRDLPVIVFRPAHWLLPIDHGDPEHAAFLDDLTTWAIASGRTPYPWAAIEAPLGVRLRALALHLAAGADHMPDDMICDLVTRTQPLLSVGGDTFIGWDGAVWLTPSFPGAFKSEFPSVNGDEIYDTLTLSCPRELRGMLAGLPPPLFAGFREQSGDEPGMFASSSLPVIAADVMARYRAIVGHDRVAYSAVDTDAFFARCAARASPLLRPQLAALVRRAFPEAYERQRRALRLVDRDIDQPWEPRATCYP